MEFPVHKLDHSSPLKLKSFRIQIMDTVLAQVNYGFESVIHCSNENYSITVFL